MGWVGCIFALLISNASWYAFCESSTTAIIGTRERKKKNTSQISTCTLYNTPQHTVTATDVCTSNAMTRRGGPGKIQIYILAFLFLFILAHTRPRVDQKERKKNQRSVRLIFISSYTYATRTEYQSSEFPLGASTTTKPAFSHR